MPFDLQKMLNIASDCIRLAESCVDELVETTEMAGLSALFLSRACQSMASVGLLVAHGYNGDAMSAGRTIVELAIDLAYIATSPATLIKKFEDHDHVRNLKLVKAVDKLHGGTIDPAIMATLQARADAVIQNDPQSKLNWAGKNIRERAEAAGSTPAEIAVRVQMYELAYADMCNASHSGFGTLKYTLVGEGANTRMRFGPQEPDAGVIGLAFAALIDLIRTAKNANGLSAEIGERWEALNERLRTAGREDAEP